MKRIRFAMAIAVAVVAACGKGDATGPQPANTIPIAFTAGTLTAEIASTNAARETGLMNRTSLGANAGMLFVFASDQDPLFTGFWMKNTAMPLSIAFLDNGRRVLAVQEMAAFDTVNIHRPATPYRYAIEANQGWFTAHGITAGATAAFTLPAGTVITP